MAEKNDRFWSKVDRRGPDECWPWQERSRNEHGYGIFHVGAMGKVQKAHRVAYELATGVKLTPEVKIRHSCDNPPCCNPAHLLPGTQADNLADMHRRGRRRYTRRLDHDAIRAAVGTQQQIAARFGCSQAMVAKIKSGGA